MTPLFFSFFEECVKLEMSEGNTDNLLKFLASNGDIMEGLDNHGGIRS